MEEQRRASEKELLASDEPRQRRTLEEQRRLPTTKEQRQQHATEEQPRALEEPAQIHRAQIQDTAQPHDTNGGALAATRRRAGTEPAARRHRARSSGNSVPRRSSGTP